MITLNDIEQRLVEHVSKRRLNKNGTDGVIETLYTEGADSDWSSVNYIGGEYAFCKLLNVYPDINYQDRRDEDCFSHGGSRIDVKTTTYENGRLLVKAKEWDNPPDYFVLMVGRFPTYGFAGYIEADVILQDGRIDHSLPHPAYAMDRKDLKTDLSGLA